MLGVEKKDERMVGRGASMKDPNDITDKQAMRIVIGSYLVFIASIVWYKVYCIIFGR